MVINTVSHDHLARQHRLHNDQRLGRHRTRVPVRRTVMGVLVGLIAALAAARHWWPRSSLVVAPPAVRATRANVSGTGLPAARASTTSRQQTLPKPGEVVGALIGHGPFAASLHETPRVLWVAVDLLILSCALVGGAVVAASLDAMVARSLLGAALPVGFLGLALAVRNHIMSDVD